MRIKPIDPHKQGTFFPKSGYFFLFSKKSRGDLPPAPPHPPHPFPTLVLHLEWKEGRKSLRTRFIMAHESIMFYCFSLVFFFFLVICMGFYVLQNGWYMQNLSGSTVQYVGNKEVMWKYRLF